MCQGIVLVLIISFIQISLLIVCYVNILLYISYFVNILCVLFIIIVRRKIISRFGLGYVNPDQIDTSKKIAPKVKIIQFINILLSLMLFIFSLLYTFAQDKIISFSSYIVPISQLGENDLSILRQLTQQFISPFILLQIIFQTHLIYTIKKCIKSLSFLANLMSGDQQQQLSFEQAPQIFTELYFELPSKSDIKSQPMNYQSSQNLEQQMQSTAITCAICLQEFIHKQSKIIKLKSCQHFFHNNCLRDWVAVKKSCPLCRQQVK
ncbi:hypothetical protein ABPG74_014610 [Tetrahymena malaccensis]